MELDKAIQNRRSVRRFKSKKPDWRKVIECVDAARFAPMAGNNYTLKFVIIDDEDKIKEISEACQQPFVAQAKFVVVACSNPSRASNLYGEDSKKWVKQQAGAAIENFLLKVTQSGLSTCWVGYFVEDQIRRIISAPDKIEIEAVFPIGFEFERPKTRRLQTELDRILYFNSYGKSKMKAPGTGFT